MANAAALAINAGRLSPGAAKAAKKAPAPGCSLEAENDLLQFLKVVRPGWSIPRRGSQSDIQRVMQKLKTIGVSDTEELIRRVTQNTINDDFFATGQSRFGRSTLDDMRKQMPFIKALGQRNNPCCRMTGNFAPVPQLLSKTNLRARLPTVSAGGGGAGNSSSTTSPSATPNSTRRAQSEAGGDKRWTNSTPTRSLDFGSSAIMGSIGSASSDDRPLFRERLRLRDAYQGRRRRMVGSMSVPDLSVPSQGSMMSELLPASYLDDTSSSQLGGTLGKPKSNASASTTAANQNGSGSPGPSARGTKSRDKSSSPHRTRTESSALSATSPIPTSTLRCAAATRPKSRGNTIDQTRGDDGQGSSSSPHQSPKIHFALNSEMVSPPASPLSEVEALSRSGWNLSMGNSMRHSECIARWAIGGVKHSPLVNSEEMLKEQTALDDRDRLARLMRPAISPMRSHIASNIRNRLKEESERDAMEVLNIQQRCINIRKNLTGMSNTRRELSGIRQKVQLLVEGEHEEEGMKVALTLDKWSSSKRNTKTNLELDDDKDNSERRRAAADETHIVVGKEAPPTFKNRLSPGGASRVVIGLLSTERGGTKSPKRE